jgi:2',3'-cyclic-nucleotide 2'-phosphodiesterase (5'-nucleotidase family)
MSFDAASVGNHEFDHGWDNTLIQLSQAKFPILLGNVFYKNSNVLFWNKPYTILERVALKLGSLGCMAYSLSMIPFHRQCVRVLKRVTR